MRGWRLSRSNRISCIGYGDRRSAAAGDGPFGDPNGHGLRRGVSCLPLLSIPVRISVRILQQARQRLLARNGTLVLFQYSHLSEKLLSRYFSLEAPAGGAQFPAGAGVCLYATLTTAFSPSPPRLRHTAAGVPGLPTPAGVQRFRFVGDEMQNRMMALPRRFDDRHLRAVGNALAAVIGMHEDAGQPRVRSRR